MGAGSPGGGGAEGPPALLILPSELSERWCALVPSLVQVVAPVSGSDRTLQQKAWGSVLVHAGIVGSFKNTQYTQVGDTSEGLGREGGSGGTEWSLW